MNRRLDEFPNYFSPDRRKERFPQDRSSSAPPCSDGSTFSLLFFRRSDAAFSEVLVSSSRAKIGSTEISILKIRLDDFPAFFRRTHENSTFLRHVLGDSKTTIFVDPAISKVLVSPSRAKIGSTEIGILKIRLDDFPSFFFAGSTKIVPFCSTPSATPKPLFSSIRRFQKCLFRRAGQKLARRK